MGEKMVWIVVVTALAWSSLGGVVGAIGSYVTLKDGYFWDSAKNDYWLPHGIAYQTWNRPLGVWQTPEQIEYDLAEMEKEHV